MAFVLALLPILLVVVLLVWLKLPSRWALLGAWAAAGVIAILFWNMNVVEVAAWSVLGGLKAFDIILIIFGAILLLNTLRQSGGMRAIEGSLMKVSGDARVQALLVGWLFSSFMEGAAGFGVPAALAAPLLVGMGWRPLAAVAFALICNSTAAAFGAIGTPMLTELAIAGSAVNAEVTVMLTAGIHAVVGIFVPLIAMLVLLKLQHLDKFKKKLLEIVPFTLFTGLAFVVPYFLIAVVFGVELPSLVGAVIGLVVTIAAIKLGWLLPRRPLELETKAEVKKEAAELRKIGVVRAWLPYALIVVLLVLTRLPYWDLGDWLKSLSFNLTDIFGVDGVNHVLTLLWSPGLWFVLVAMVTVFLHGVHRRKIGPVIGRTIRQVSGAALALVFGVALAQIMINTGDGETASMVGAIALGLSQAVGPIYLAIAPILGALGAFVSGSNTVSNMLFTPSQLASAINLGLPTSLVLALQCVGGSYGNIIAVNNIVAASATVGLTDNEGQVIKINIVPLLIILALVIIIGIVFYLFLTM
jgi:lactate permease